MITDQNNFTNYPLQVDTKSANRSATHLQNTRLLLNVISCITGTICSNFESDSSDWPMSSMISQ